MLPTCNDRARGEGGTGRCRPPRATTGSPRNAPGLPSTSSFCTSSTGTAPDPDRDLPAPGARTRPSAADDVLGLGALLPLSHLERDLLAFNQLAESVAGDVGVVREDVRSAAVLGDEAEALFGVE